MSKASQRRQSAYQNGYSVGRYGWPEGVRGFRIGVASDGAWRAGLRDGKRDRNLNPADSNRVSWYSSFLYWLSKKVSG